MNLIKDKYYFLTERKNLTPMQAKKEIKIWIQENFKTNLAKKQYEIEINKILNEL